MTNSFNSSALRYFAIVGLVLTSAALQAGQVPMPPKPEPLPKPKFTISAAPTMIAYQTKEDRA